MFRWKKFPVLSKTFQDVYGLLYLLYIGRHQNHSIKKKKCPIISEHVAVKFVAQYVTIATKCSSKNILNFSFKRIFLKKNELGDLHFIIEL